LSKNELVKTISHAEPQRTHFVFPVVVIEHSRKKSFLEKIYPVNPVNPACLAEALAQAGQILCLYLGNGRTFSILTGKTGGLIPI
jgi:3-hydroxymyristoyl/3-hydroxydecanoyl-(acyl carrier protein) dehydratase